jgi:XPA protein C-terminus
MELTLEQKERIRVNRERALEILKRKREQEAATAAATTTTNDELLYKDNANHNAKTDSPDTKRHKGNDPKVAKNGTTKESKEDTIDRIVVILEEFEETASEWVTKAEAKKMYCLPEGTLAVCTCVEKPNPHNKAWTPMKMYSRAEVRTKARTRYGGVEGLIAERQRREENKFAKDMERSQQIFATSSSSCSSKTKTATTPIKKKRKM